MATINYFISAKKRKTAPIYVRFSAGRKTDLIVKSGIIVETGHWSNNTQSIRQRIKTDDDEKLIKKLKGLKDHIESEFKNYYGDYTKEWLTNIIDQFHNKKDIKAKNLNDYISKFIRDAKKGDRKNKSGMNFAPGSVRTYEGFQRIFNEYQGTYTDKRIEELQKNNKIPRSLKKVDFEDITVQFYENFKTFLSNEGYQINTIGRFIKALKFFMQKSLNEKLHNIRDFQNRDSFAVLSEDSFTVYLTKEELDKLYKFDLKIYPRLDLARDAFIVLCETALRVSDYSKIDLNIREKNGMKLIYITQSKTKGAVVIPLSARMEEILKKYDNKLPRIPEQHVNKNIKIVAKMAGIDQVLNYEGSQYGKTYKKTVRKYELITCHSGRRTACTLMHLAGIDTKQIMLISGHTSEKAFMRYIRVTPEENALNLAGHEYFSGNKLKVVS